MCRTVLAELEAHDEAWPFLLPVNTKQFPTYKKIIKNPMDLSTIKKRINEGVCVLSVVIGNYFNPWPWVRFTKFRHHRKTKNLKY